MRRMSIIIFAIVLIIYRVPSRCVGLLSSALSHVELSTSVCQCVSAFFLYNSDKEKRPPLPVVSSDQASQACPLPKLADKPCNDAYLRCLLGSLSSKNNTKGAPIASMGRSSSGAMPVPHSLNTSIAELFRHII